MIQFLNHKNSSSNQLKVDEWSNQNKGKNTGDYMRLSIFILYCCISVKIRFVNCDPNRYVSQCFSQAIYQCSKARGKRTLTLAHPWLMYSMWYKLFRHFIYTLLLAPITFDFTLYASECFGMFYLFMLFIACTKLS